MWLLRRRIDLARRGAWSAAIRHAPRALGGAVLTNGRAQLIKETFCMGVILTLAVGPRLLVPVGERPRRATHSPLRGPAPDQRDCRIRHGGWLLMLCLTMGETGKLRGRPESRACRCGGGAPLPGSSACPDWPTRSQAEWRLRHARGRCCRCVPPSVHRLDVGRQSSPSVVTSCPRRA